MKGFNPFDMHPAVAEVRRLEVQNEHFQQTISDLRRTVAEKSAANKALCGLLDECTSERDLLRRRLKEFSCD